MKSAYAIFWLLWLAVFIPLPASAAPIEILRNLDLPPSQGAVKVLAAFHLLDISEIDEELETFAFSGVPTLKWLDQRQAFDAAEVGVDEMIYQGQYQFNELSPVWYPQVVLTNPSGPYDMSTVVLRVKPDGSSTLIQTINAVAEAQLDLKRIPFDSQRLVAVFEVFGFAASEVTLEPEPMPDRKPESGLKIPQWTVTGMEVSSRTIDAPYAGGQGVSSALALAVNVQRKFMFMVKLVMMPVALIVMLSWCVFWMDRSSLGDRISVSFVGILTAAYQIVVGDITPHIAYATLLNRFLDISFWVMCATVIINLIVGSADKQRNFDLGDRVDRDCRVIFPLVYVGLVLSAAAMAFR